MNTYTVTFHDENDGDPTDVEVLTVTVESEVEPEDLAAGDWDAHERVVWQARQRHGWETHRQLGFAWEPALVRLPDGEVVEVPAGLE